MSRTLVISDIHGCYREFKALLRNVDYKPLIDKLILLGDYMDRGSFSRHTVEYVMELAKNENVITLFGNHDQMFLEVMNDNNDDLFLHNGGLQTITSFCGDEWLTDGFSFSGYNKCKLFIREHYSQVIEFLSKLPLYHEDESHIYVHAGLDPSYNDWNWKEQPTENFLWIREVFLNNDSPYSKTIVHGHTPTPNLHRTANVYFGNGKIGIDGGCCFGSMYQLNCLVIEDGEYQTFSVRKGDF